MKLSSTASSVSFPLQSAAALLAAAALVVPAVYAATPNAGQLGTAGPTLMYTGTADGDPPGVGEINPNPLAGEDQDKNLTEGDNVDTYTLTVNGTPAEWGAAKKIITVKISWTNVANDYDLLVRKDSNTGTVIGTSGGTATTSETVSIDPSESGTGVYKVRAVYFNTPTVQQAGTDQYKGTISVVPKPQTGSVTLRNAVYVKGGMTFSPSHTMAAPFTFRDGEPSSRIDKHGNYYIGGIRGVPAGIDLWYFDLRPTVPGIGGVNPKFDPLLRNPIYRGRPDAFLPAIEDFFAVGADGGGDIDMALGTDNFDNVTPPAVAITSLVAANLSAARSLNLGETFELNPLGNLTAGPGIDDRQWMEAADNKKVYLYYRTISIPQQHYIALSTDGGLTYLPSATLINNPPSLDDLQTGSAAVDRNDGTVYASREASSGGIRVAVGSPNTLNPLNPNPISYTNYTVVSGFPGGTGHIFVALKVAKNGWVYACWSNETSIWLAHSKNKGQTWSAPVRVSDGPETKTSVFPWLETGDVPGAVNVVWYGTSNPANNDAADWHVYIAQTFNATDVTPTFRQVRASDHVIHAANISEGGLTGANNRNLIDYFQIAHDPQGAAVIGFTDDHNDNSGNCYVTRQITGPSINGSQHAPLPAQVAGSQLPPVAPAKKNVVEDFTPDARSGGTPETGGPINLVQPDPIDIVRIVYNRTNTATGAALTATMKVSDLTQGVPAGAAWRMLFAVNVPNAVMSPTGEFTLGTVDRGDLFYLAAVTDASGRRSFEYGTQKRENDGTITYTKVGDADRGAFNPANGEITVRVGINKINTILSQRKRPLVGNGSIITGLRGIAQQNASGNNANKSDLTRGGGQFPFLVQP